MLLTTGGSVNTSLPAGQSIRTLTGKEKLPIMRDIAWKSYQKAQQSGKGQEYLSNATKFFQSVEVILRPVMTAHTAAAFAVRTSFICCHLTLPG